MGNNVRVELSLGERQIIHRLMTRQRSAQDLDMAMRLRSVYKALDMRALEGQLKDLRGSLDKEDLAWLDMLDNDARSAYLIDRDDLQWLYDALRDHDWTLRWLVTPSGAETKVKESVDPFMLMVVADVGQQISMALAQKED